jgi:hypothetical protein
MGQAYTKQREVIDTFKILIWKLGDMKLFGARS